MIKKLIIAASLLLSCLVPASAQFADQSTYAGTGAGSANAQTITLANVSQYNDVKGVIIKYIPGASNTSATTLTINSIATPPAIERRTQLGLEPLVGGEIITGVATYVMYDGTEFQIVGGVPTMVGSFVDFTGSSAPAGTHFADGSCEVRAGNGAALFSIIGTTYDPTGSTCDGTHFALPDFRGRVTAYQDNMGSNGAANRITNAASGCTGTTIGGAGCGAQTKVVAQANLAAFNLTVTDPGHSHALAPGGGTFVLLDASLSGASNYGSGGQLAVNETVTSTATTGISVASGGSSTGLAVLNPLQIVTKVIQY